MSKSDLAKLPIILAVFIILVASIGGGVAYYTLSYGASQSPTPTPAPTITKTSTPTSAIVSPYPSEDSTSTSTPTPHQTSITGSPNPTPTSTPAQTQAPTTPPQQTANPTAQPTQTPTHTPSTRPSSTPTPTPHPTPSPTPKPTPSPQEQAAINTAAQELDSTITYSLAQMQEALPKNPNNAALIQAKIAMLQNPTLYSNIVNGGYFEVEFVASTGGNQIPIVAIYPLANMSSEASELVTNIKLALPHLETFMALPFPQNHIYVWYGFIIGNLGGFGDLFMEDKSTYEGRWHAGMNPYEPIYYHELSHSYIGHESLNQFLEIYQYNLVHTGSTNMQSWTFLRDYNTWNGTKTGYAAMLDIYKLIGHSAMANAYHAVYLLHPPYGTPLSAACKQVFIDAAPASAKASVTILINNVIY